MELQDSDILCEDGAVIAVNKSHGVIVQGAPQGVDNLADMLRRYLARKYQKQGNVYLGIPHRLDRPVTGVVAFSKNSKCAARLSEQFAKRQVEKTYLAVIEKPLPSNEGELIDWIFKVPEHSRVEISSAKNPAAKQAILNYRTLETVNGRSLIEIQLGTGRMHQIRIQLGSRGSAIVGDTQYGSRHAFPGYEGVSLTEAPIALHARQLTLLHPIRYEPLPITAPFPRNWRQFGFKTA